jgi:hypothetical protein
MLQNSSVKPKSGDKTMRMPDINRHVKKPRSIVSGFTGRLIGQILVDGGFISRKNLKEALDLQKNTNEQIGTILMHMGVLPRSYLDAALSLQHHLASLKDSIKVAAGIRQLLGELLIQTNRISRKQLEDALQEQKRTGEKIGIILVRHGSLTEQELESVLRFQKNQGLEQTKSTPLRLGEILVTTGQLTRKQLEDALKQQKLSDKKIGQILVEAGYVKPEQVSHGLKLQHMLITASLAATLSFASMSAGNVAHAGSANTKITVSARVLARTSLKMLHQIPEVTITGSDIRKGYVEIKSGSRIEVRSNNPAGYMLTFQGVGWPFREIHIHGLSNEVQISSDSAFIHQPYVRGPITIELSYRLVLSDNVKPGTYSWPLSIASQPI